MNRRLWRRAAAQSRLVISLAAAGAVIAVAAETALASVKCEGGTIYSCNGHSYPYEEWYCPDNTYCHLITGQDDKGCVNSVAPDCSSSP
jgi:hypothetical protein